MMIPVVGTDSVFDRDGGDDARRTGLLPCSTADKYRVKLMSPPAFAICRIVSSQVTTNSPVLVAELILRH
jgi:hypothetical protein